MDEMSLKITGISDVGSMKLRGEKNTLVRDAEGIRSYRHKIIMILHMN